MVSVVRITLFIFFAVVAFGCTYFKNPSMPAENIPPNVLPFEFDRSKVSGVALTSSDQVRAFYDRNTLRLIWSDTFKIAPSADSLITFIRESENYGLIPTDYHLTEIEKILDQPITHENAVYLDLYLTDCFFTLRAHLRKGRLDPKTLLRLSLDSITSASEISVLKNAIENKMILSSLNSVEPKYPQYALLKTVLDKIVTENLADSTSIKHRNQVVAALERWRWERPLPDRYISVNVPSYQLKVLENDSLIFESRIIVGKKETPTPNIRSVIRSFIIYPYWHVPKSIVGEILPAIQQDTIYLKKHNYQVLDKNGKVVKNSSVDWRAYDAETFPYVLRQREGSENTMGVIKFVFANNYGVYLHDTNARRLFSKTERNLSHGCVRVQKAVGLAHYLAKDDDTFVGPEDLDQYLLVQHKMVVNVVKPIPVHLDYFSVEVVNGKAIFYDDIYGWDKEIVKALEAVMVL
jgi:murein L,D-transpeptidase YcbB/YkuD